MASRGPTHHLRQGVMSAAILVARTTLVALPLLAPLVGYADDRTVVPTTKPLQNPSTFASNRFDFGGHLAVQSGCVAVSSKTMFSADRGFGWLQDADLVVRDQGRSDPSLRDFVMGTKPATFRVAGLSPDLYRLRVVAANLDLGPHATRLKVSGSPVELPVMPTVPGELATLQATVDVTGTLDIGFDSPEKTWIVSVLSIDKVDRRDEPKLERKPFSRQPDDGGMRTLVFDTQGTGIKLNLTRWGLDTAWPEPNHIRRGLLYMGKDQVDVIRVSFPVNEALINDDLPPAKKEHFDIRLRMAKLAGELPLTMLPDTEGGVHPWFKNGKEIISERWVDLIAASQRHYGRKMESIEPFNEADWGWGQGGAENLRDIVSLMEKRAEFDGVELSGPSTFNADVADAWYQRIAKQLDRGTTHSLWGSFSNYVNFYLNVVANGQIADQPEIHNLVEVIAGAEYGLQQAIWWGTAERSRGDFVKAVQGERLAYAEDRTRWSAAGVYRAPEGNVQAFLGSSERLGQDTTFRFVSRDRNVFFDGVGPRRDFAVTIRKDTESLVNITWGEDVPPPIAGTYVLMNLQSGKVLGVSSNDHSDGASIEQMDFHGEENQQWEVAPIFTRYGDQSYMTLRADHSGKVLAIPTRSYEEHVRVLQQGDGSEPAQQWFLEYGGDNAFYVRNRWSTQCLEPTDDGLGSAIQQASKSGQARQLWRLVPAGVRSIDLSAPQSPRGLTAAARSLAVELNWQANDEPDLKGYTIFRSTTAGGPYETIARDVSTSTYDDNEANKQQQYHYVIKSVDHSFNQSGYSAEVAVTPNGGRVLAASYAFDGNTIDNSGNANHAVAYGNPTFGVGPVGLRALVLDGDDDHLRLPMSVVTSNELTLATWVFPQGNVQWQRVFDLGNDESQYFFLTVGSEAGTLRLAAKNGGDEQRLEGPTLPDSRWSHVAVTLSGNTACLFVNGELFATSNNWTIKPGDFEPVFNYIGKSQFPVDPVFRGRISGFQIHNYAVAADDIARIATRSSEK